MNDLYLGFGEVRHARRRPTPHRFRYPVYFLRQRIDRLPQPRVISVAGLPLLGIERPALITFRASDHGDGSGDLRGWLDGILTPAGIIADGPIWLHSFCRVFGYTFKPVSFWYCHRADGRLVAILAEVNNTFGERHSYLIDDGGAPLRAGASSKASKAFHVSPFLARDGDYSFRFLDRRDRTVARIDYAAADGETVLATSLSGRLVVAGSASALRAAFGYPLFTLMVMARIHWHALRLWLKRVPFVSRPVPPAQSVTRRTPPRPTHADT